MDSLSAGLEASQLVEAAVPNIAESWALRMREDPDFSDVTADVIPLAIALARTLRDPQDMTAGPEPAWKAAIGSFVSAQPSIGITARQLLYLEEAVAHVVRDDVPEDQRGEVLHRLHRAVFWGLEVAARLLAEQLDRDDLTGLSGERGLTRDIERAITRGELPITLVAIDMDGLKAINDADGHEAGNAAIRTLASNLASVSAPGVSVYRTHAAGDEFAMLLLETRATDADRLVEAIRARRGPEFSVGIATYPDDSDDWRVVQNRADQRMYEDKRARKERAHGSSR